LRDKALPFWEAKEVAIFLSSSPVATTSSALKSLSQLSYHEAERGTIQQCSFLPIDMPWLQWPISLLPTRAEMYPRCSTVPLQLEMTMAMSGFAFYHYHNSIKIRSGLLMSLAHLSLAGFETAPPISNC
jgi:hypothetical protein